jgi:hypothetical protein
MDDRAKAIFRAFMRDWASIVGVAFVLALFGPYETSTTLTPVQRVVFWLVAALGTAALVKAVRKALQLSPWTKHWPVVPLRLIAAVLGSVPVTLLMSQIYAAMTGMPSAKLGLVYVYVLLPTAFFSLLLSSRSLPWFTSQQPPPPDPLPGDQETPANTGSRFLARHAARFANGTLLALEAEDHYLRVHTDTGSELILMRLRDAIGQLTDTPGLQVHRSFWVAQAAIAKVQRRGAQAQLTLHNGLVVPVSRTYMNGLKEAGWLDMKGAPATV